MEENMRKIIFITLFLLSQLIYSESNSIEIDLGKDEPNKGIIQIRTPLEKVESLKIINKFSDVEYSIDILAEIVIPPLDFSTSNTSVTELSSRFALNTNDTDCKALDNLIQSFVDLQNRAANPASGEKKVWREKDLSTLLEKFRTTLKIFEKKSKTCSTTEDAKKILKNSVHIYPVKVNMDTPLMVVITRGQLKWKYLISSYSTPRGKWYTSYGFSFISPAFKKSDNFFVKTDNVNNSNEYTITQKKGSKKDWMDTNFVPSIFFWWMPTKRMSNSWTISPTGGLGIDFKNPTVFAGIGFIYNYNIGINIGVALHKQYRLKDKYEKDMKVNEILEFDDLHKSVYNLNPFLSITFRFGSNPFASAKTDEKPQADKK
jgi:hypothetical protein